MTVVVVAMLDARAARRSPGPRWPRHFSRRPWVHGKMVGPDGKVLFEQWLSSNRELAGVRAGPAISFHDHKRKVFTKYVPAENVVYRLPEPPEGTPSDVNFLTQLLDLLLDPAGPSKFPFPGMELIGQTRREVEEDGKKWLEIELTLRVAGGSRGGPLSMRIRVDPATKLPNSFADRDEDGKRYTASIDYPDRGPADIYDLGVPRTAKVDRPDPARRRRPRPGRAQGRPRASSMITARSSSRRGSCLRTISRGSRPTASGGRGRMAHRATATRAKDWAPAARRRYRVVEGAPG